MGKHAILFESRNFNEGGAIMHNIAYKICKLNYLTFSSIPIDQNNKMLVKTHIFARYIIIININNYELISFIYY